MSGPFWAHGAPLGPKGPLRGVRETGRPPGKTGGYIYIYIYPVAEKVAGKVRSLSFDAHAGDNGRPALSLPAAAAVVASGIPIITILQSIRSHLGQEHLGQARAFVRLFDLYRCVKQTSRLWRHVA